MKQKFNIEGMTCAACVNNIKKTVEKLDGVSDVNVNLVKNSMLLNYDPNLNNIDNITKAVESIGYKAYIDELKEVKSNNKNIKYRLIISIIFTILLMYISMSHMIRLPLPKIFIGHENAIIFSFTQLLLTLPVVYVNKDYYIKGFKGLIKNASNMDTLIAIGSLSALVYGVFAIYMIGYGLGHNNIEIVSKYHSDLYFESCAMILTLVTVGKYLEEKSKNKTKDSLENLIKLKPKKSIIEVDGKEIDVLVEDINVNDIVIIKAGDIVSVDGIVVDGSAYIDESFITGESLPVYKEVGSKIIQSTINTSGFIKVKALKVGNDTLFSEIIRLVEEASLTKAPISKLADKISGIFVPFIISISIITFLIWFLISKNFSFSLSNAISVLLISCPCALGLATPLSIMVATGKAAENGILIKSGEALEVASNIDTIVFDKTGTITSGKLKVVDFMYFDFKRGEVLDILYSLEKRSEHPISKAVVEYCKNRNELNVENFETVMGKGISGCILDKKYYVGSKKLMLENNINIEKVDEYINSYTSEGKTILIISNDEKAIGILSIIDTIKDTSEEAISKLNSMGIKTIMLTGDNNKTATTIGKNLKLDEIISDVLPTEKESVIVNLKNEGRKVLMVGDGVNDSIALIKADVGIAMGSGIDVAIDSGDVVLISNDLLDIVNFLSLSKKTIKNIKENLFWAFCYNIIGIPIAAGIFYYSFNLKLNPMLASFFMSISSLFVVLNSLRLRKFNKNNILSNQVIIKVYGMSCNNCVKHVKDALNNMGIFARVDLSKGIVIINDDKVDYALIKKTIEDIGYKTDIK